MSSISFIDTVLMLASLLVAIGILSSLVATRFGAPLILVFLGLGMLMGEDGPGGIHFSDYHLTYLIGSTALAIILFDGGLHTRLRAARGAFAPALLLSTGGVLVTAALTGTLAHFLLGIGWTEGLLLGAAVASTDAAAVFFLLRAGGLQLRRRVGATLEIESGTNDPVAVFLVILLVGLIARDGGAWEWSILSDLARQAVLGTGLGITGGFAIVLALNRLALPPGLHGALAVTLAVLIYSLTAAAGGSGFLAVYLAGLVTGNRPVRGLPNTMVFLSTTTWLCQIGMFLVLGLLISPSALVGVWLPGLTIALFLIVVGRPVAVWLCLTPFGFTTREKSFVAWVGLRGAVSIFMASIPMLAGLPNAQLYFNIAFCVVLVSLLVQGWTITSAARRLDIALARTTRPVTRTELDLPGQADRELVGYPLLADSPAAAGDTVLPGWATLVLVVRGEDIFNPIDAGRLVPGDYAYLVAPTTRVAELDRLFRPFGETSLREAAAVGEFRFNGGALLGVLAELYGLPLTGAQMSMTVADLFASRFDDEPEENDSIAFGEATLVARKVTNGRVAIAGLRLPPEEASPALPRTLRQALAARVPLHLVARYLDRLSARR
ncbi:potassium/proton antiporter [Pseudoxanthobacter sp.]|uniref:potassium/proton antiporter n=1 Tax=Pseudoxanthobacter sp. TaxID=1925742 RepID=UPI002FDF71DF